MCKQLVWLFALSAWLACSEKPATGPDAAGSGGSEPIVAGSGGASVGAQAGAAGAETNQAGSGVSAAAGMSGVGGEAAMGPATWIAGDNGCPVDVPVGDPIAHAPIAQRIHDGVVGFLEGPIWIAAPATLYYTNFIDIGSDGRIRSYQPAGGIQDILLEGLGVNGLAVDTDGMIVAGFHQEQRLLRIDPVTKELLEVPGGSLYQGLPLNSVNDVVARADGQLYFTDPTYQRGERPGQPVAGAYHLTPTGLLTLIDTQEAPNGIALSPDGRALYVAGSGNPHPLMKYELMQDGSALLPGAPISDLPSDGMAVDCAGNLYLTTGSSSDGKITVLTSQGLLIGSVSVEITSGTTNAAFGGPDYKTLFVTTNSGGLFEIPMLVPGLP